MDNLTPAQKDFILYQAPSGEVKLSVLLRGETIWLTQKMMAELFQTTPQNITIHLRNIFTERELQENATCKEFLQVRQEGGRTVHRKAKFYNLDAVISVGYRVNSSKATQFRIWATQTLKEFILKGFVVDDERLKQGEIVFGEDYFQDLLETVRSIRASERRIYQQITDIFRECSIDYDANSPITKAFYAMVQNSFTLPLQGKLLPKLFTKRQILPRNIWG